MMTILDIFYANVEKLGGKTCLKYKSGGAWHDLSWKDVSERIQAYANSLSALGVKEGDRVGIISGTRVEWTLADMAILSLGAVVVPIYPTLSEEQTNYIIKETECKVVFVENEAKMACHPRESGDPVKLIALDSCWSLPPNDRTFLHCTNPSTKLPPNYRRAGGAGAPASIIYTSGTTGTPKGVVITHANIMAEVTALRKIFHLRHDEIMLTFLPLAHVLGRATQFYQLAEGCQAAYAESLETVPENLKEIRPHMTVVVPRFIEKIYERMMDEINMAGAVKRAIIKWGISTGSAYGLCIRRREIASFWLRVKRVAARYLVYSRLQRALGGRIKFIVSGGAPLSEELSKFFFDLSLLILDGYGLTETFAAITVNRPDDFHFGTAGKPLSGAVIKIADDGEILVRGGMVFKDYYEHPDETSEAFTPDGWFKTGDVGEFSRDGFLRITDRKKDIIVTAGGKKIAPQAIETVLEESPYINHAVVFGDGRKYISALVSPDLEEIGRYAKVHGISLTPSGIRDLVAGVIDEKNRQLSHFEMIRKFAIVNNDFTVGTGELTPTLKVRRKLIEKKYKEVIDDMYMEA